MIHALGNASTRTLDLLPLTSPRPATGATPNQRVGGNVVPALIFAPLGWNRCCGNLPHYQSSRAKKCCNKNLAKEGPADHARHAPFVVRLLPSTRRVSHGGGRGATCGRGPLHAPFWYARVGLGVGCSQVSRTGGGARNWRSPALCPAFVTMPVELGYSKDHELRLAFNRSNDHMRCICFCEVFIFFI